MNESLAGYQGFCYGQEGQKLSKYVAEQLNGEETKKNQQILMEFQRQAHLRRHNYLRRHLKSIDNPQKDQSRFYTLDNSQVFKSSSFNHHQEGKRIGQLRYPLIPTDKQQPPIYRYESVGSQLPGHASMHINPNYKYRPSQVILSNSLKRGKTPFLDPSAADQHRTWALQRIKESLDKKKNNTQVIKIETERSEGEKLMHQLEKIERRTKQQQAQLSRKLKKLRKYRRYIIEHERYGD